MRNSTYSVTAGITFRGQHVDFDVGYETESFQRIKLPAH